jgi:glycosyltransferase involved in cell wall biosynthesis
MGLSAIIITDKKVSEIGATLQSVVFANEVLVIVDQEKPDKTSEIPGARVYYRPLTSDFAAQRNFGLAKAGGDWVLFIDDDEIVTTELADEIKKATGTDRFDAYYLPRRDIIAGKMLKHGETGNMKITRLAKKSVGKFVRPVHEVWEIKGRVGELKNPLLHYRENYISAFIDRIALYGPLDARALKKEGKPFAIWRMILYPKAKFLLNYFLKLGFLDGYLGFFQAYLMSIQSLSIRVFQWQNEFLSK